jgi:hypothetical protein
MPEYSVLDLLKFSNEGKPQDFKTAFDDVMQDRISNAIDVRRDAVTDQMFNGAEEEEVEVEAEAELDADAEIEIEDEDFDVDDGSYEAVEKE